ncbi:MAG: hypothetical protein MZV63_61090 [Marinilabiliales bacterium]|nr:hypothetical protein [Marinilabiliales bacterium]
MPASRFDNQVSTWFGMNFPDEVAWQAGARYIPTLSPWVKAGSGGRDRRGGFSQCLRNSLVHRQ